MSKSPKVSYEEKISHRADLALDKNGGRKLIVVWSLDEKHLYLYDEIEQYNLINISFDMKYDKKVKIQILKEIIKTL